jgi:hypothetical protein
LPRARRHQAAQHLDRRGLAGAVGAEQAVDLAVADIEIDAFHGLEAAVDPAQVDRGDRRSASSRLDAMAIGDRGHRDLALELPQDGDERVLERGRRGAHALHSYPRLGQRRAHRALSGLDVGHHHVQAVAEALNVRDAASPGKRGRRAAQVVGLNLEALQTESLPQLCRRARAMDHAVVHERHAMAALGLVEIRRGEQDRHALGRELGQRVPELAARDRIDAGGRLVQQQDASPARTRAQASASCRR